jgi:hypothetical protein
MTRGRSRFQKPLFISLGELKAHDFSGRDDKGDGGFGPQWERIEPKSAFIPTALAF